MAVTDPAVLAVETVPIAMLKPHPRNYQVHPDDEIEHLMESLREHGWYKNVVTARDLTVLAGHGILEAARRLEWIDAPVHRTELDPNEPRALKLLAADNELRHLAEVDDRALSILLKEVHEGDPAGLLGTGYDAAMLAALVMVTRPAGEIADFDEAAQWVGVPAYESTPLRHTLMLTFASEDDQAELIRRLGLIVHGKSAWWPPRERDDGIAVRFEDGDG